MMEAPPCRRCGSTKTASARHGLIYNLAYACGYRLRECGGCRHLRLIPRKQLSEPNIVQHAKVERNVPRPKRESNVCPFCGSDDFRRSRRRWFDLMLGRRRMARCRDCRRRFPARHIPHRRKDSEEMQKSA